MNLLRAEELIILKRKTHDGHEIEKIVLLVKYECINCPEENECLEKQPICFTCGGKGTYEGIVSADNVVKLINKMIMRIR